MRRERTVFVLLLLGLLLVSSSFAGMTRINNLGLYSNLYVLDSYNIWAFPSTIVLFPKMATIESMSGDELNSGGIHMPLSPTVVGGAYLKNSTEEVNYAEPDFDYSNDMPDPDSRWADHQADLFLGYNGGTYGLGMHISSYRSSNSYTTSSYEGEASQSVVGITLGTSFFATNKSQFDASLAIRISSFNNLPITSPYSAYEGKSNWGVAFAVRYFAAISPTTAIVPFGEISIDRAGFQGSYKTEPVLTTISGSYVDKSTNILLGVSVNYVPNEKVLVVMAIGYQRYSYTYDIEMSGTNVEGTKYTTQALPFLSIGFESRLYSWLSARFGIYEILSHYGEDDSSYEYKETDHDYVPNFGLSFYLKRFTIDAMVNDSFLHNGPYLLSGHNYGPLFSELSITYAIP